MDIKKSVETYIQGPAYMAEEEAQLMAKYAKRIIAPIVEIGPAYGGSTVVWLWSAPTFYSVISIDPFVQDSHGEWQANEVACRNGVQKAIKALASEHHLERWELKVEYSHDVALTWTKPVGLIYIDGNHHYEYVKQDVDDWFPKLVNHGYMLLHDSLRPDGIPESSFCHGWPGPTQVAKELKENPKVKLVDSTFSLTVWEKYA